MFYSKLAAAMLVINLTGCKLFNNNSTNATTATTLASKQISSEQLMKNITGYGDGFIEDKIDLILSDNGALNFKSFMNQFNGNTYTLNGVSITLSPSFINQLSQEGTNVPIYIMEVMRPAQKAFQKLNKALLKPAVLEKDVGYADYLALRQANIDKTLAAWRKSLDRQITRLGKPKDTENWHQRATAISYADASQLYLAKIYASPNYKQILVVQNKEVDSISQDIDVGTVEEYPTISATNLTDTNVLNLDTRSTGDSGSIPYYFSIPESSMLQDSTLLANLSTLTGDISYEKKQTRDFSATESNGEFVGQRRINVQLYKKDEASLFNELVAKQIIKDGDLLLTYRSEWADSLPYAHITMGVSHVGMVWRGKDGKLYNADQPLDADYSFDSASRMNFTSTTSKHYRELTGYHIIRPRTAAIKNINQFNSNMQNIMNKGQISIKNGASLFAFNSNYFDPRFKVVSGGNYKRAYNLSNELYKNSNTNINTDRNNVSTLMFCSEFAWAMLNLAGCSNGLCNDSSGQIFDPIPFLALNKNEPFGMSDGPLAILNKVSDLKKRQALANNIFKSQDKASMSAGHRAVNQALEASGTIKLLNAYYMMASSNADMSTISNTLIPVGTTKKPMGELLNQASSQIGRNYSPTSFLVNTFQPSAVRQFDYVATVYFGN